VNQEGGPEIVGWESIKRPKKKEQKEKEFQSTVRGHTGRNLAWRKQFPSVGHPSEKMKELKVIYSRTTKNTEKECRRVRYRQDGK